MEPDDETPEHVCGRPDEIDATMAIASAALEAAAAARMAAIALCKLIDERVEESALVPPTRH